MMYLETERLILRDYKEDDREAYFRLKSDPKTMYYLQDIQLNSCDEANADFQKVLDDQSGDNRKYYFFHMELKDTHQQVGSIGYTITAATPVGRLADAGYFTYPEFWNHGYVTEAFHRVLEFAFCENNIYRISTGCLAENGGSEKVMRNCGLIQEAEHLDYEWHDGLMKTRLEFRLLKREWDAQHHGL